MLECDWAFTHINFHHADNQYPSQNVEESGYEQKD